MQHLTHLWEASNLKTEVDAPTMPAKKADSPFSNLGPVSIYLLISAACGWVILIGNLFPLAVRTNGIVPAVQDLTGLILSSLLLLILALTPVAIRQTLRGGKSR